MQWKTLLDHLLTYQTDSYKNPDIQSIDVDSRKVQEGSLFVCIPGYTVDGHDYIEQAAATGARAILAEHAVNASVPVAVVSDTKQALAVLADALYNHPTKQMALIGVTGTNGKTTTTHLIEKIFADQKQKTGLIGTLGMKMAGEAMSLTSTTPTTPEASTLQKTFAHMAAEDVETTVMEVSSHALDMGRVWGCDFNIAVFTNLTRDHLEYHQTMEDYLRAKSLLFSQLGNTYDRDNIKAAVINGDDPHADILKKVTAAQTVTYGVHSDCDIYAQDMKLSEKGTQFSLQTPYGETPIELNLIGLFNVYNALAAAAAALLSGLTLEQVKASLETASGVPGRFERVEEGQTYTVIVDYAHTPDSLENVLATVQQFAKQRIFVVVGCGGDRDRSKRPMMAKIAVQYADVPVLTSDNPRSEEPGKIIKDMADGIEQAHYISISDRAEAIRYAVAQAAASDIIVIAGKGHETYQVINDQVIDFDDREIARKAIRQRMKT